MPGQMVDLLDNSGVGIGTFLVIVLALVGFSIALIKVIKNYNKMIADNALKQEENQKVIDSVATLVDSVENLRNQIEEDREYQKAYQESMDQKLDALKTQLEVERRSSNENDKRLQSQIQKLGQDIDVLDKKSNLLIESDKEGIKHTITQQYYKYIDDEWIPIHALQGLEQIYEKYLQENGNTFVAGLMEALRELPNKPPVRKTTKKRTTKSTESGDE